MNFVPTTRGINRVVYDIYLQAWHDRAIKNKNVSVG